MFLRGRKRIAKAANIQCSRFTDGHILLVSSRQYVHFSSPPDSSVLLISISPSFHSIESEFLEGRIHA